jgi:hypothetical protein
MTYNVELRIYEGKYSKVNISCFKDSEGVAAGNLIITCQDMLEINNNQISGSQPIIFSF